MERIRMIGLGKSFGVRQVFSNVSFEIKEGDRIALVGPNGAGKSTLLKCILGIEELDEGQVVMSPVASIGYLQQDVNLGDASLAEEIETAWEDVHALENKLQELTTYLATHEASESDLQRLDYLQNRLEWLGGYDYEQKTKRIVYGLGFTDEDLYKPANAFSGGQKTRINLAKALVRSPDFLFLDEPTNHLDMHSKDVLMQALKDFGGTVVFVSHDRGFIEGLSTRVLALEAGRYRIFPGDYAYYLERIEAEKNGRVAGMPFSSSVDVKAQSVSRAAGSGMSENLSGTNDALVGGQLSWEKAKKRKAEQRKLEREVERLEAEIAALEAQKAECENELAKPEVYASGEKSRVVQKRLADTEARLTLLGEEWEAAAESAERAKAQS